MKIPYFHVNSFAEHIFAGNPAGVCPLRAWLDDSVLLSIAKENNLAETAFFIERPDGGYDLRWFSPAVEVDLCGHATLAAAHVLWNHLGFEAPSIGFHTLSGTLAVRRREEWIALDFPSRPAVAVEEPAELAPILGGRPDWCGKSRDYLFAFGSEEEVRALSPDFARLVELDAMGIIATAPGEGCDFVSRFFAPRVGINEDPATGSSHCTLIPYWAERLHKTELTARQVSGRGGRFECRFNGSRVEIAGHALTYTSGEIHLP